MRLRVVYLLSLTVTLGCSSTEESKKTEISERFKAALSAREPSDQVLTYRHSQAIEHSQYLRQTKYGNVILAAIRDKSQFNLVRTDFGISFQFDDQNRLIRYEIKPRYTGP
jgi:hypothetical protein